MHHYYEEDMMGKKKKPAKKTCAHTYKNWGAFHRKCSKCGRVERVM